MAFFKLSDLSEKEKKKYLQSIEDQVNERLNSRNSLEKEANDKFNNIFNSKYGQNNNINVGNTNDWATSKIKEKKSVDNLLAPVETKINEDLYKNDLKNSAQQYYDNNNISYKNKNIFEDILGIGENLVRGASSGLKQTMNYATAVNKGYKGYNDITNKLARAKYLSTPIQDRKEEDLNKNFIEEAVNNSIQKDNEAVSKNINSMSGKVTQKLSELAPSIGQMGVGAVLSSVNPALGTGYFYSSAAGGYLDDAKSRGMNEKHALMYSSVLGGLEATTETVGIRNFEKAGAGVKALLSGAGKEGAKTAVKNIAKKEIATSVKDVLKNYGIGIADNFIQEAIMDPLQEISATAVAGKEKADWSGMGQKMLQDGINGGLVAAIVGGANLGINSCIGIVEKNNNGQNVSQTEYKQALQDAQEAGIDIQQNIKDKINEQMNNLNNQEEKTNTENLLNRESVQDIANNSQLQQNNNTNKTVIKDFNESAKRYNIDYNNEDLKEINQMYNKRGITTYFDENTFKNNKDVFSIWKPTYDENGNISGREVVFNPNSQDTKIRVQELAIHELGHDLELNEVQNMILKDASRKENWKNARKSLEDTYKQAYENDGIQISKEDFNKIVDEEATMSILQRELGSQEYVNRLVNQNQSIAKKIYNWVIDKLNKFTGGKNEKLFWTDIRNKFETAYNQEFNKNDSDLKYSIAGKKGMQNAIRQDASNKIIEQSYNKALSMQNNGIDNESIRKATNWFQDKNGDWKFEITDKDMSLKPKIKLEAGKTYELGDILNHDLLFEAYPELKKYKVEIRERKANGSFNRENKNIVINTKLLNNTKAFEGTLIHEIQHAIQNIEGFEGGTSSKKSRLRYYNSLGEIEATNTKERFLAEKYNNKNMAEIAPESSKEKPQHKDLQKYLNNRNLLDKIKDYMYNKTNEKGGISHEISEKIDMEHTNENNRLVDGRRRVESENNSGSFSLEKRLEQNYALSTKDWQQFVENNYQQQGTGKNLKEYKLPIREEHGKIQENNALSIDNFSNTKKYIENNLNIPTKEYFENKKKLDLLTDEDYSVLNDIYEKEGKTEILTEKKKANILEKYVNDKYKFKDSFDELAQRFINKGHYIDKLSKEAKNPELKYVYDRNLNSFAEGQYEIGVAQTNNEGKKIGKSINEIWEPIEKQNLTKEFSEYLLHKHNIDRSERNKYVFGSEIGPAESTAIAMELEQKHPEFKEYAKDIKKFNHNNLQCLVDAGLLSNDMVKYLEAMYPNYVTISRDLQDSTYAGDKEKTGVNAPIKSATGGNSDIQPLKDTMAQQAIKIKRLINQNMLGQELAKTLKNAHIEQEGSIQLSPTMLFGLDTLVDADTKGNKYYTYFENGELQKLKIDDNLYESLKPTERSRLEETLPIKALQKVTSLHRSVLTSSNPIFIVTNFFKDFQDGMFNSKYSSKFVKNYGKALNEIMTRGEYYETYMANGGMNNTYFDYNEGIKKKPNKFVEKIRNANEIVEQLPRMSEFISTLEDGKSLNEALYNAAEITTNFKRGGDITKAINRNGVNFLNASIQGLDKQFRNFSEQKGAKGYVNLLVKATLMGVVPSILNHILLDDDKDYEKLPESTKDLYYLFKTGEGKFIRIPKGRVLSVFGAAARRTLESIEGNEDAWKGFKDTVINQVAPNNPLEDNILAPIMQVKNNKTWYGSELVSSRLQKELPKNQYDETTDEFSKWLGSKINASPKKINYLIDQYSGGVGDVLLPMITPQAKQNVFKDKFTTDSVLKNKYVSKFYETLEKQNQIANDPLATDEDEIQLKYLNNTSKEMGKLYKEKRNVQMSNISNKEKTAKVREIQEKINELAESSLQNYTNFTKTQNSAKIGDQEYYKNGSGEWTSMNEETKQKNSNISTETYSDYKQKVYQETQKQRANGTINKNQSLKQKDKIQILLNSKYSDKEKKAIYSTYIKNEQDTEYEIMNYANTDIDEYLKYKQQGFDSDYADNGTINGKAISGSKQRKVYEYINSAKMTYEQKLLLLGMQYKLTSGERSTLAKYVDTLNITSDEKLEAYKKIKGFTVYKNGKVSW